VRFEPQPQSNEFGTVTHSRAIAMSKARYVDDWLCCLSASCCAAVRDSTPVLVELVNIIGTPSFQDIHVSAVLVLSNLLQEVDTVQV